MSTRNIKIITFQGGKVRLVSRADNLTAISYVTVSNCMQSIIRKTYMIGLLKNKLNNKFVMLSGV
jgi:hypothetical protein